MSLTAKDVETITRLIEESVFDELILEIDGLKLELRRGAGTAPALAAQPPAVADQAAAVPVAAGAAAAAGTTAITAPMLGTFYRAPKPGAPPFVEVGSQVEPDAIIGIIEVMKLMNAVRAGVRGRIAAIPAGDGALVEYGEILMRIEATA